MTPADPDYGVHHSRMPPEELLIFSVLSRAITDLFGTVGLTANADEAKVAKQDALTFLTQKSGGWAKRRNELCDAVGIDGDEMRDRVIRVLEGDLKAKARRPKPKPERSQNTVVRYSDVRPIILKLLDRPRSFKDLITATNGEVSDSTIRKVLQIGVQKGELVNLENNTYLLASVPETAVAAAA